MNIYKNSFCIILFYQCKYELIMEKSMNTMNHNEILNRRLGISS